MLMRRKRSRGGKKETILVVEDNNADGQSIRYSLEKEGYDVALASNVEYGWDLFQRANPALVLTDLMMPNASGDLMPGGLDLLMRIRGKRLSIPVIVISGLSTRHYVAQAFQLGADDFIDKNSGPKELKKSIEQILALSQMELEVRRLRAHTSVLSEANRKLQEQLDRLSKGQEVDQAGRAMDKYKAISGSVVHDLKSEFLHIGNSIRVVRDTAATLPGIQEECDLIERSVDYSQLLLRRLLNYIEIGKPKTESVRALDLVRRTEMLARPRLPSSVQLDIAVEPNIREQRVSADAELLMGVLLELINNAANVLRENGGTIELKVEQQNSELAISVKDNGPGMPKGLRKLVFKGQVSSKSGLGLGIFLSSKVIAALGGKLSFQTSSKRGTTSTILLPIANDRTVS